MLISPESTCAKPKFRLGATGGQRQGHRGGSCLPCHASGAAHDTA